MLRLNPSTLSHALGQQLLDGGAHLKPVFEQKLLPLISTRLLDPSLQRSNSGSIGLGSALSLFLATYRKAPKLIAEVGTYIGNSAAAMGYGSGMAQQAVQLITCDMNPCTQQPFEGLHLPDGSKAQVVQGSSTKMFELLSSKGAKIDMLHLDGRLMKDDLKLLRQVLKPDTLIALDDCEGDETLSEAVCTTYRHTAGLVARILCQTISLLSRHSLVLSQLKMTASMLS